MKRMPVLPEGIRYDWCQVADKYEQKRIGISILKRNNIYFTVLASVDPVCKGEKKL
jgi:hypothetical protein